MTHAMEQSGNKVLVLGMNPGNNPKAFHYKNHTIDRLNQWCAFLGIERWSFSNCVDRQGDVKIKDVDFEWLESLCSDYDKIIALGNFPSICLGRINKTHFKLPHPSPRNRVMNDKQKVNSLLEMCKEYIHE